jgi:hypothetical protein
MTKVGGDQLRITCLLAQPRRRRVPEGVRCDALLIGEAADQGPLTEVASALPFRTWPF